MGQCERNVVESCEWAVDLATRELRADGVAIPIGSRAFEIIETLVRSDGEIVTKNDLMKCAWPGASIVEDATIRVHISAIRKALGADRRMLQTVPGRGYRLVGNWTIRQNRTPAQIEPSQRAMAAPDSFLTNVPVAASALLGRETAVQRLQDLVSAYRAVTLVGPGGIGKTVLASEVARRLFPTIESDVFFVELVPLSDPQLVPSTVASVLGLRLGGDEISPTSVARAIGSRKMLLVLDNCEHVIGAAAGLAETLLRLCPHTTVLATSREVLRIEGEFIYQVAPLEVPSHHQESSSDLLERSAVQLFIARTGSLRADFLAHGEDLPTIAAVVRRLDGIPLAIEFAAARAATLGVQEVAGRLDDRFALLTGGRRTALPRHQTLRATLDWSYELLTETERRLLRRVAIFPAGFTLDAATAVMNDDENSAPAAMEGIANLVEKSLVTLDSSAPSGRWRLLETIRAYALEKLGTGDEAARAARAHAEFFRDLVVATAPASRSDPSSKGLTLCLREIDNVRAALDWSFSRSGDTATGIALTAAYVPAWIHSAMLVESRERIERALDSLDPDLGLSEQLRLLLYMGFGSAAVFTVRPVDNTRTALLAALDIAENLNDMDARLWANWSLWMLNFYTGDIRAAFPFAERLPGIASSIGEPFALAIADRIIGNTLHHEGDQRRAQYYFERVIERCVVPAARRNSFYTQMDQLVFALAMLSRSLLLQGFLDQAAKQAQKSLEEAIATEYELAICQAFRIAVCPVALMTGDLAAAEQSLVRLVNIANNFNAPFWNSAARCLEGKLLIARGDFAAGSAILRSELDACEKSGWTNWYPEFLGVLAEGLAGLRQFPEAIATIDRALDKADRGGERYYLAELLRLKGEFLLAESDGNRGSAIDDCFHAAMDAARQQGALLLELRAALSLARLRVRQHRPEDARQILAPVYGRFVEGFAATDLRAARELLRALEVPPL
ncbi:winged helix-turn-helix domain-containing protein [Bradyrhizobium sp. Pha-3]|uniref:ATP-binding protein n=1 Tax=Bradyrhizobium sp. Pha-3 TaxID=208375 RepID=UPI0035D480A0